MWRIPFTLNIFWLLIYSLWIRISKAKCGVKLPSVPAQPTISRHRADDMVRWFDTLVSAFMWFNRHLCFYRSVTLATLLRKQGIPLVMNVGGRGLGLGEAKKAHCWLTLDERLFHEKENALELYPLEMGYNRDRSIRYWIGPELKENVLNGSQFTRSRSIKPLFRRFKDL